MLLKPRNKIDWNNEKLVHKDENKPDSNRKIVLEEDVYKSLIESDNDITIQEEVNSILSNYPSIKLKEDIYSQLSELGDVNTLVNELLDYYL
jgi:hypothetical protein